MRSSLVLTDSMIWTAETEYALSVAAAESGLGWDVTLAAPRGSAAASRAGASVALAELPGDAPGRSPADFVADARFISGLWAETRFDLVHSSGSASHLLAALAVARRAPLVHLRGGAQQPRRSTGNRFLYGKMTTSVIASSERIRSWVVDGLGVPAARVHRVLAPVDLAAFAGAAPGPGLRSELGISEEARLVVNVARLAPIKGQRVLVEAMPEVVRECPDAVLVLVGEAWSGQPAALLGRAQELGLGASVVATGRRNDVPAILAEAAVCVCSSVGSEENSRAVSEYMAAGRPVVATRVGVVPELVEDGVSGILVEPGNSERLAAGIIRMLTDEHFAVCAGARAREFAERELSREAFAARIAAAVESGGSEP